MSHYHDAVASPELKSGREMLRDIIIGTVATAAITGFALHYADTDKNPPQEAEYTWSLPLVD